MFLWFAPDDTNVLYNPFRLLNVKLLSITPDLRQVARVHPLIDTKVLCNLFGSWTPSIRS